MKLDIKLFHWEKKTTKMEVLETFRSAEHPTVTNDIQKGYLIPLN